MKYALLLVLFYCFNFRIPHCSHNNMKDECNGNDASTGQKNCLLRRVAKFLRTMLPSGSLAAWRPVHDGSKRFDIV
jgi:hypothetical protein